MRGFEGCIARMGWGYGVRAGFIKGIYSIKFISGVNGVLIFMVFPIDQLYGGLEGVLEVYSTADQHRKTAEIQSHAPFPVLGRR